MKKKDMPVFVNYNLSVEVVAQRLTSKKVSPWISDRHFKTRRTGRKRVWTKLFEFKQWTKLEEAVKKMRELGYRPAEFHELLAFGASSHNPYKQDCTTIAALGAVGRNFGRGRVFACLLGEDAETSTNLGADLNVGLPDSFLYLAVRDS